MVETGFLAEKAVRGFKIDFKKKIKKI